jgi:nucleoside-diphosphate-sugar epimerase
MDTERLRGARIAVTGASGFVGGRVVDALVARGARVDGYGRRPGYRPGGAHYTRWDIADGPLPDAPRVDALVHCAGMVTDWGHPALFHRCHVDGTRHVLASFAEPCAVVHVSTASVYDPSASKRLLNENAPQARRYLNAYSATKAIAERLVLARTQAVVLRPHALYGPGDRVLLPRLLDAYRGGRLLAAGDGTNRVSLTHVDNLVDAIVLALQASLDQRARGVYNIADAEDVVIDDALRAVLAATGREPRIVYLPRSLAYGLGALLELAHRGLALRRAPRLTRYRVVQVADEYTLDLTRARQELGYRPTRDLLTFIDGGGLRESPRAEP